jgi:hypothetical protein
MNTPKEEAKRIICEFNHRAKDVVNEILGVISRSNRTESYIIDYWLDVRNEIDKA